jgi:hypothetical protein
MLVHLPYFVIYTYTFTVAEINVNIFKKLRVEFIVLKKEQQVYKTVNFITDT